MRYLNFMYRSKTGRISAAGSLHERHMVQDDLHESADEQHESADDLRGDKKCCR